MANKRKREDRLVANGPSYLFHYEDEEFWGRVKVKAAGMGLSIKGLIILALEEKIGEKD